LRSTATNSIIGSLCLSNQSGKLGGIFLILNRLSTTDVLNPNERTETRKQREKDRTDQNYKTNSDLDFLLKLEGTELTTLVAVIRDRVEGGKNAKK
jgi:hypothetical protein